MTSRTIKRSESWRDAIAQEEIDHSVVKRARNYLRQNYKRNVSLGELARHAGMNKFALAQAFTKHVGIPPHFYLLRLRVVKIEEMIKNDNKIALSYIALEMGFADQSHMTRRFSELTGITPAQYKKRTRRLNAEEDEK